MGNYVQPPIIPSISSDYLHDHPEMVQGSHILAFAYSSISFGWMHKASFDPVNAESHNTVACWIGWTLVSNETSLYSQHNKVTENIIAGSISRDFHRSDQTLTNIKTDTL